MSKDGAEVATLDYLGKKKPTAKDAKKLEVLRQDWGHWQGGPDRTIVDGPPPWWMELAFVAPPVETFKQPANAYGHWASLLGAWNRDRWNAVAKRKPPPKKGAIVIEGLEVEDIEDVEYEGDDPRFAAWVAQNNVTTLHWTVGKLAAIDLSASCLDTLELKVHKPLRVKLPTTLERFVVVGASARLTVEKGPALVFPFRLELHGPRITAPPRGMEDAMCVEYDGFRDTDSAALAKYTRLTELTLRGGPGRLTDGRGLAKAKTLRELTIYDVFELDLARWSAPALEALTVHGVKKEDAVALKQTYKAIGPDVAGGRDAKWIADNLGNPFRDWDDGGPAFGRAAVAAWKKADAAAKKLGAKVAKPKAKAVLDALVVALNRADATHGSIDTIRREEAVDAYFTLARRMTVPESDAEKWLDVLRDW